MLGGLLALIAGAGVFAFLRRMSSGVYAGPVSDHFDGTHFVGPYAVPSNGTTAFWRWQMTRDKAQWPAHLPNARADKPPPRVESGARVSVIGHASHLIQAGGLNILVDPVWSERVSPLSFAGGAVRVRAPGIVFDDLPKIDAVLITHGHYDHLDVATLARLVARDAPRIVAPLGHGATIKRAAPDANVTMLDWHDRVTLSDRVAATLTPAQHWTARGLYDRNKALWGGYVVETPAGKIFHVTDTGYHDTLFKETRDRYGPFRLAIIPIGAYEPRWFMRRQHVNPEEAVRLLQDCGAQLALAQHFGVFQLTDEAIDAPVIALREACNAAGIPHDKFVVPEPGSVVELS